VLAILLEEKHRQQAGARPAAGRDVERRRRLADLLAIPAGDFPRTCWITFQLRGITSNVSVTSSPSLRSRAPPQHMQVAGAGSTTRSRGRCSGKGWPRALAGESRDIGGGAT
jgi:hypothetical protein